MSESVCEKIKYKNKIKMEKSVKSEKNKLQNIKYCIVLHMSKKYLQILCNILQNLIFSIWQSIFPQKIFIFLFFSDKKKEIFKNI